MTRQTHRINPLRIANEMHNDLSVRHKKGDKSICKIFTVKVFWAFISLIASITLLPLSLQAQGTTGTLAENGTDSHNIAYAMMGPSNTIAVINLASREITDSIAVTGNPHGGALTPDGSQIYTSSMNSKWVSVIDTRSKKVITKIDVGGISHHATVRRDGRYVYVAAGRLIVIDTATNEIIARIKTLESPFYPAFDPDGRRLYVLSSGSTISVIDSETNTQIDTIKMGSKSMMGHLAVAPDGGTLYATNDRADRLSIIDVESGQLRAAVSVGKQPHGIAVQTDGERVFVGNRGEKSISVVDPTTAKVVATRKLGGYPEHLSMTSKGDYLLVGLKNRFEEEGSRRNGSRKMTAAVTILDPNTLEIIEEIPAWPQVHDILVPQTKR